jgi:hypoxanthine-guanine phosphoribosyltransferase
MSSSLAVNPAWKLILNKQDIEIIVELLAQQINKDYAGKDVLLLGVLSV